MAKSKEIFWLKWMRSSIIINTNKRESASPKIWVFELLATLFIVQCVNSKAIGIAIISLTTIEKKTEMIQKIFWNKLFL